MINVIVGMIKMYVVNEMYDDDIEKLDLNKKKDDLER